MLCTGIKKRAQPCALFSNPLLSEAELFGYLIGGYSRSGGGMSERFGSDSDRSIVAGLGNRSSLVRSRSIRSDLERVKSTT
jgi:hypothetical protein